MTALPASRWQLASAPPTRPQQDLVFVKLTDSALRAIEDFLANKGKLGSNPTIQFTSQNEGKISIPNANTSETQPYLTTFRFSLANNTGHEGPQGSFECLHNGAGKSLRTLGPMPTRMQVQANEDVYEATKHRMAIDVENQKSKFTRVIKPNQTDIGRKVKVKQQRPPPSRPPNMSQPSQHQSFNHSPSLQPLQNYQQTTVTNGYAGNGGGPYNHQSNGNIHHNGSATTYNGLSSNKNIQPVTKPIGNNDVQKRPIRERLIHLLALKPYKKPELYNRLNSEGIKEKEKNVITTILHQISAIKDNCYQLHRHIWNEVIEDWNFYTEEEKQILKRRKPQNLTPPLSSDSGHSPSPPPGKRSAAPSQAPPLPVSCTQPPNKKQRISHYRKPQDTREPGEGSPAALSNGYHSSTSTSGASSGERKNYSDEDTPPPVNSLTPNKKENSYSLSFGTAKNFVDIPPIQQNGYHQTSPSSEHLSSVEKVPSPIALDKLYSPVLGNNGQPPQRRDKKSPDSTTQPTHSPAPPDTSEIPDYVLQYPEITCLEQKRQYKTDFAAQYEEYRLLHSQIMTVTGIFSHLEEQLNGEQPGGTNYKEIKRQIINEYKRVQRDGQHQRNLDKFHYLHTKLAHIKSRVGEYDRRKVVSY